VTTAPEITVRRADDSDRPSVLDLLADSLGWERDRKFAELFAWKHVGNPFGPSAAWVAVEHEAVVGFRTFLRWQFEHPDGRTRHAVRAVDAATSAAHRRHGIFRRLTLTAVDELIAEGVDFVFNTPNRESMAGNLALGWTTVGRVPITAHVRGLASAAALTPVAGAGRAVAGLDQCRRGRERRAR
jgi:GNAT superfamily N-acetyltransferase